MADSRLVTAELPAHTGNYTKGRAAAGGRIREITVHHCAGVVTVEQLGALWQRPGRCGSSHYGVQGSAVGQYVAEADIAWTNSDWAANCRAVTIEVSNSGGGPDWPVSGESFETLARLAADIARRNGLGRLKAGENLTWHSMYAATACPGLWLLARMEQLAEKANRINEQETAKEGDGMQFVEVFGEKNCQCFSRPDVNAVDTSYRNGRLESGACYPLMADAGEDAQGYRWLRVYAGGAVRYTVLLADRCRVAALSAGDAVKAVLAQGCPAGAGGEEAQQLRAELEEAKRDRLAAEAALAEARQRAEELQAEGARANKAEALAQKLAGRILAAREILAE